MNGYPSFYPRIALVAPSPGDGVAAPNISWRQYKLNCMHTASCDAVNYDFTANICTQLPATCTKAIGHPDMLFALLTRRQPDQYLEWIPISDGPPVRERSVTEDNSRFVTRMQKGGNDLVCYLGLITYNCPSRDDNGLFSTEQGHPCQYLRIRNGYTVMYVNYELGTPLPQTAVIGGYTADGLRVPVYIGLGPFNNLQLPGYYTPGSMRLVAGYNIITENIKILVLL